MNQKYISQEKYIKLTPSPPTVCFGSDQKEKAINLILKQTSKFSCPQIQMLIYELEKQLNAKLSSQKTSKQNELPSMPSSGSSQKNWKTNPIKELPKKDLPEGLPNLGNTCFMNCSLQFLYAVDPFKGFVKKCYLNSAKKQTFNNLLKYVGEIFYKMQFKSFIDEGQKKVLLNNIVVDIEQRNLGQLRKYQHHEDALEIVTSIINGVSTNLPQSSHQQKWFILPTENKCDCYSDSLIIQNLIYKDNGEQDYCASCRRVIMKKILSFPEYLLVFGKGDQEILTIQSQPYEFISKIVYTSYEFAKNDSSFGFHSSSSKGHYICMRKENNSYFQLNDNFVRQITKDEFYQSSKYHKTRLILYKKLTSSTPNNYRIK